MLASVLRAVLAWLTGLVATSWMLPVAAAVASAWSSA